MSKHEGNKYRIKVEVIDGSGEELDSEYVEGIECKGFVILGMKEDGCKSIVHEVSTFVMAQAIAGSSTLMAASAIAKGLRDAMQYTVKEKLGSLLSALGND